MPRQAKQKSYEELKSEYKNTGMSNHEFEQRYEFIKNLQIEGKTPSEHPKAIILGGQPGAGKSSFYRHTEGLENYVIINGDDFRRYHRDYFLYMYKDDLNNYSKNTQNFTNNIVNKLITDLSKKGYNLIIEGTMRNPDTPRKTVEKLLKKNYDCSMVMIVCDAITAFHATMQRAECEYKAGIIPRFVQFENYDNTVQSLPESAKKLFEMTSLSPNISFCVKDRECKFVWPSLQNIREKVEDVVRESLELTDWDAIKLIERTKFDIFSNKIKKELAEQYDSVHNKPVDMDDKKNDEIKIA